MQNSRIHNFIEGKVVTDLVSAGGYCAHREDDDQVRGYGHSRYAAIAALSERLGGDDEEDLDHQAAAFDHAYDLRKHERVTSCHSISCHATPPHNIAYHVTAHHITRQHP